MRDVVNFRTEIDVGPYYLDTEFFLKVELFYAQPPQMNFQAAVGSADVMKKEAGRAEFKLAQMKLF